MSNLKQFFREVDKKATDKRKTHGWCITPISVFFALLTTIYLSHNATFATQFEFIFMAGFLISVLSVCFYIAGNFGLLLWAFSEQSYPPVQGKVANAKRIVKIFINLPNANQLLRILRLLNDILEKNGFENWTSINKFMKDFYDDRDAKDKKITDLEKDLESLKKWKSEQEQLISKKVHAKNNDNNIEITKDEKFE